MISRMPGGLDPPVAAHHGTRDRDRLQPDHQIPGPDPAVWVPIVHPCWSGSMPVLVEGAAEPVPSADTQLRDPLKIGNRIG